MKLLSALFDAALLPLAIASDIIAPPFVRDAEKSFTRERIEKVEEDLGL